MRKQRERQGCGCDIRERLCIFCYTHVRIYICEYTRRLPNVYIKAYTLLYLCISGYTHCYIPTIYRKPEAVPKRKLGGRNGWHIHILLYTSDCAHKLYSLGCCLGIMLWIMLYLCILSYTLFVFIVYIMPYGFVRFILVASVSFISIVGSTFVFGMDRAERKRIKFFVLKKTRNN